MKNIRVSRLVFCPTDYQEEKDMYKDIATVIPILTRLGYQLKIWYDGLCTVIDYDYQDVQLSNKYLRWVDVNEWDKISMEDSYEEDEEYD